MTRKDFKAIADQIAAISNLVERKTMAIQMAEVCRQSNPRFDFARFYQACGV
jgi:hypothetical protein